MTSIPATCGRWTALCAKTKIIPAWRVGDRSHRTAYTLCADLQYRVQSELQIAADGHPAYQGAISANFKRVNYSRLVKIYGKNDATGRDAVIGTRKEAVMPKSYAPATG